MTEIILNDFQAENFEMRRARLKRVCPPKTQKQRDAASVAMTKLSLTNNPMKNPEVVKKNMSKKHILAATKIFITNNPNNLPHVKEAQRKRFIEDNPMKRKEIREKHSILMTGRKVSALHKETARNLFLIRNPMKNPEVVKKQKAKELETKRLNKLKQEVKNE
ncbi:MAG: hypothetical protein AABY22_02435 [Nanoarchaeota archaeon]